MDRNRIQKLVIGLILFVCLFLKLKALGIVNFNFSTNTQSKITTMKIIGSKMTYGQFLKYLEMGWIKQIDLYENSSNIIAKILNPKTMNQPQLIQIVIPLRTNQFIQKVKEYNVDFNAHRISQKSIFKKVAMKLFLPIIIIISLIFFFRSSKDFMQKSNSSPLNLVKSITKLDQKIDTGVAFNDIAGINETKEELEEIILFLKEPERYDLVGAKIPTGILLFGPPGTGKTLLAKAIATEANVPFYRVSGSEFVERFIGIGAARMRDLFKKASKTTPCIIFIDEIDAVGRERESSIGRGNYEREQTLNQLLTEMDGFKENKGVIVIGATNCANCLDRALLRPGRFDRQLTVNLPDRLGRIEILKVHARKKLFSEDVSFTQLANRTSGFSGADLANLLNEAAILTTRHKKQIISKNEINEATDRIIGGIAGTLLEDTKNKKLIAYRKIGHAIVGSVLKNHDRVEKITLIPRGNTNGQIWFLPKEDQTLVSRSKLIARIIATLGGIVTEKIVFGKPETTTGTSSDLQQVTYIARQMVTNYGMSTIGPIALNNMNNGQAILNNDSSDIPINRIDSEISKIVNNCEKIATEIILNNRVVLDLLVDELLDKETIFGHNFRNLLCQYTILPSKNL